jgi:type I restriction enzyme R subunit
MTTGVDAQTCKLVVLDQTIQSMTKFKQIIGRGTRINDKFNKLWFTILDFKKATELFADERFDGIPEKVMITDPIKIIDQDDPSFDDELNKDDDEGSLDKTVDSGEGSTDGGTTAGEGSSDGYPSGNTGGGEGEPYVKYRVKGVAVNKIAERVQYYDTDGKLVTESFKDYTRNAVTKHFASLDDFVRKWKDSERKQAVIDELAAEGVIWQALEDEVGKDMDPFDLICHIAYDQPPLTRKERAENVKKRNYFAKYSAVAQTVLNVLVEQYADAGISQLEQAGFAELKVPKLKVLGNPMQIVQNEFGGKPQYKQALSELEEQLYTTDKIA